MAEGLKSKVTEWGAAALVLASVFSYPHHVLLGALFGVVAALVWIGVGYSLKAPGLVALNVALFIINSWNAWRAYV